MARSQPTRKQVVENLRLKGIIVRQNQELQALMERTASMGYVLTYLVLTATEPIQVPMEYAPPTDFIGLDLVPDPENGILNVVPSYKVPDEEFAELDEVEAEIVEPGSTEETS